MSGAGILHPASGSAPSPCSALLRPPSLPTLTHSPTHLPTHLRWFSLFAFLAVRFSALSLAAQAEVVGWATNGPAVYARVSLPPTNTGSAGVPAATAGSAGVPAGTPIAQPTYVTNNVFDHFLPASLHHLVWTNFIAHTNGRSMTVWSVRLHPPDWPTNAPTVVWNTNCLLWGMKGMTALSPCWECEGSSGQVPITALTRRHGYARGHGMGPDGFRTNFAGKKVWFVTADNTVIQMTVLKNVVRTAGGSHRGDYSILLFSKDLPPSIEPIRVMAFTNLLAKYPGCPGAPQPFFETEQMGNVSANVPGFTVPTWKGGDSGSPNMLPMPGELIFTGGRSTSGPSPEMQQDMDALCVQAGLDPKKYQLQWVDLAAW